MVATCPMDGCDYEGAVRSVEAHISGKNDEAHEGKLGRNWRRTIEASHGDDDQPHTVGDPPAEDTSDDQQEAATEAASESTEAETTKTGLGVPPGVAVVLATVALAVVVVATSAGGGAGGVEQADEDDEGDVEEPVTLDGAGWS